MPLTNAAITPTAPAQRLTHSLEAITLTPEPLISKPNTQPRLLKRTSCFQLAVIRRARRFGSPSDQGTIPCLLAAWDAKSCLSGCHCRPLSWTRGNFRPSSNCSDTSRNLLTMLKARYVSSFHTPAHHTRTHSAGNIRLPRICSVCSAGCCEKQYCISVSFSRVQSDTHAHPHTRTPSSQTVFTASDRCRLPASTEALLALEAFLLSAG